MTTSTTLPGIYFKLYVEPARHCRDDFSAAGHPLHLFALGSLLGLKEFGQSRDILAHQILVKRLDCARGHSRLECRGRNQDSNTPIAVSFVTMRKKKAQREHHYIRVVITYTDGETSGHRIFKDETKAKEWAERQNRSVAVKKVRLERFVRDAYAATKVRVGPKQRAH